MTEYERGAAAMREMAKNVAEKYYHQDDGSNEVLLTSIVTDITYLPLPTDPASGEGADSRRSFEAWFDTNLRPANFLEGVDGHLFRRDFGGVDYGDPDVDKTWRAWSARDAEIATLRAVLETIAALDAVNDGTIHAVMVSRKALAAIKQAKGDTP